MLASAAVCALNHEDRDQIVEGSAMPVDDLVRRPGLGLGRRVRRAQRTAADRTNQTGRAIGRLKTKLTIPTNNLH